MHKFLRLGLLLLLNGCWMFPQPARCGIRHSSDSLTQLLQAAPSDTQKVHLLIDLSCLWRDSAILPALQFALQAEQLATASKWPEGRIKAGYAVGACYEAVAQWPKALSAYHACRQLAMDNGLAPDVLHSSLLLSEAHNSAGHLDSTMTYKLETLRLARLQKDSLSELRMLNYLGGYYFDLKQPGLGRQYWQEALQKALLFDKTQHAAMMLNNLSDAYMEMGKKDSALLVLQQAEKMLEGHNFYYVDTYVQSSFGHYYSGNGQAAAAIDRYNRALELAAKAPGTNGIRESVLERLSRLYAQQNQHAPALDCYQRYIALRDSNWQQERIAKDTRELLQYDYQLQASALEAEHTSLKAHSQWQRRALTGSIIGLLALASLAGFAWYELAQNRKKSRTISRQAQLLHQQNHSIQQSLAEKTVLMKEIHHRVKNNLQVISSLLQMQARRSKDVQVRTALEESQNRVLSISFIHQNLYQQDGLGQVEMGGFLSELVRHLQQVYRATGHPVLVRQSVSEAAFDMDIAVPVGLIVNELLTNSYKYAFQGREEGHINIGLRPQESPHLYQLEYSDDGPGLPPGINPLRSPSLGLTLVHDLCRQLGGKPVYATTGGFGLSLVFSTQPDND